MHWIEDALNWSTDTIALYPTDCVCSGNVLWYVRSTLWPWLVGTRHSVIGDGGPSN